MLTAICALTRGYNSLEQYNTLINRNNCIYEKIYSINHSLYDCILFHEGNITEEHQSYIKSKTPNLPIIFIDVSQEFDNCLNKTIGIYSKSTINNQGFTFGYKCMCRFWFGAFIKYTNNYKYVIRIDEDCYIYSFPHDTLNNLLLNNIYFSTGLVLHNFNDHDYAYGLPDCTNAFLSNNNINIKVNDLPHVPYTNYCIINVEYFRNCELFDKWYQYIDNEGGIFVSRWGDANLWGIYLILSNLIETNFTEDKRIKYYHGTHNSVVN